jgi:hypothetical protein
MESRETQHWPDDPLDEGMVLFDYIVEGFGVNDINDPTCSSEFEDDIKTL